MLSTKNWGIPFPFVVAIKILLITSIMKSRLSRRWNTYLVKGVSEIPVCGDVPIVVFIWYMNDKLWRGFADSDASNFDNLDFASDTLWVYWVKTSFYKSNCLLEPERLYRYFVVTAKIRSCFLFLSLILRTLAAIMTLSEEKLVNNDWNSAEITFWLALLDETFISLQANFIKTIFHFWVWVLFSLLK